MRVCLVLSLWTLFVSYVISASPVISSGHLLWVWLDHRKHDAESVVMVIGFIIYVGIQRVLLLWLYLGQMFGFNADVAH